LAPQAHLLPNTHFKTGKWQNTAQSDERSRMEIKQVIYIALCLGTYVAANIPLILISMNLRVRIVEAENKLTRQGTYAASASQNRRSVLLYRVARATWLGSVGGFMLFAAVSKFVPFAINIGFYFVDFCYAYLITPPSSGLEPKACVCNWDKWEDGK
jgi:hypothetical protein